MFGVGRHQLLLGLRMSGRRSSRAEAARGHGGHDDLIVQGEAT